MLVETALPGYAAAMPRAVLDDHAEFERIAAAAERLFAQGSGIAYRGTLYRATHPRYAAMPALISGQGSLLRGSRWNPPHAMRVLHGSEAPEHAVAEALAVRRRYNLPDRDGLPLMVRAIHCDLRQVLDLHDGTVRQALRVSADRLLGTNWEAENKARREAISQAVGRAAADAGFEGLRVPSAMVAQGVNLVVFMDHLGRKGAVRLDEPE